MQDEQSSKHAFRGDTLAYWLIKHLVEDAEVGERVEDRIKPSSIVVQIVLLI